MGIASTIDVAAALSSSREPLPGLTQLEAEERLRQYGFNDPAPRKHGALALELLLLFLNPLVIILLIASLISVVVGQPVDASIILVIAMLSVTINFVQTYRSQRALQKLHDHVSLTATVLRDGRWREVRRENVVPGDLVRLCAGDLIPADGRLLESRDLFVQQAALTGESMPAEKSVSDATSAIDASPESPGRIFLGTSVVSGTAVARITATGARTSFGLISAKLRERPPETEFERGLRQFGMLIMRAVLFLILFILVVRVALHKDAFESFLFAVALAVGLTPEFLPMITSVTLGRGAVRMAREQVIVKHLPAIQNFGSIDILCSDKTGTLTTGVMTLQSAVDAGGEASDHPLALAFLNSKFETGIRSPLDTAILQRQRPDLDRYSKRDEIPFDFNRRRLSIVVDGAEKAGHERTLIVKGAPEGILPLCTSYEFRGETQAFESEASQAATKVHNELCTQGFRVLAIAYRYVDQQESFTAADEHSLTLAGFLAFADPPSADAEEAIEQMKRDGIHVKILTGDNELVTRHVCEQVGLQNPTIVLGNQLDAMSDPALGAHR